MKLQFKQTTRLLVALALALVGVAQAGPYERAQIRFLNELIDAEPDHASHYFARGQYLRADTEYRLSLIDFDRVEALGPDMPELDFERALVYNDMNRPEEGLLILMRFLERAPENIEALELQAEFMIKQELFLEADTIYENMIDAAEEPRLELILRRSMNLQASGDLPRALQVLEDGIIRVGASMLFENKALALEVEMGAYDAAINRLDRWLTDGPMHRGRILKQRADVLVLKGDLASAFRFYEKALVAFDLQYPNAVDWPALTRFREELLTSIEHYRGAQGLGDEEGARVDPK